MARAAGSARRAGSGGTQAVYSAAMSASQACAPWLLRVLLQVALQGGRWVQACIVSKQSTNIVHCRDPCCVHLELCRR